MTRQILLFDIGNTSIKVGLAQADSLMTTYTLRTDADQTADSLGLTLFSLLQHAHILPDHIEACLCSSVVPSMTSLVREAVARFVGASFYTVPQDISVPLKNCYDNPHEVGADRLVCAYAARILVPQSPSLIVVDFGTATTFDCVTYNDYLGGIIFPGVHTAAAALSLKAAKLPRINLDTTDTEPAPGRDTASSMQHGILFGFAAMVEGLSQRLARQLEGPVHIMGTGGFAKDIAKVSSCFDSVLPNLILDGLRQLYFSQNAKASNHP